MPDAEEERPPYFAGYGNVDFTAIEQVNKRIFGRRNARENNYAMAFVIIAAEVIKSPEALAKFIIERNITHYKKCLAQTSDERQRQVLQKLLAEELANK